MTAIIAIIFGLFYIARSDITEGEITASLTVSEESATPLRLGVLPDIASLADHYSDIVLKRLEYTLLTGVVAAAFSVNRYNGALWLNESIDRDRWCPGSDICRRDLLLSLRTRDGSIFRMLRLHLDITDVNDNKPTFPSRVFRLSVLENAPVNSTFYIPMATDIDSPDNGVVAYSLSSSPSSRTSHSLPFVLHTKVDDRGVIDSLAIRLTTFLNREVIDHYTLYMEAIDAGGLTGQMTCEVNVADIDDNAPLFLKRETTVRVEESREFGRTIVEVIAFDPDQGLNGEMVYSLTPHSARLASGHLRLNGSSGQLTVGHLGLDYEERSVYELQIQVAPAKDPIRVTDSIGVLVIVLDRNDEIPLISVTYVSSSVEENKPKGQRIALVSVTDPDTGNGGTFHCSIAGDSFLMRTMAQGIFQIETNRQYDRELEAVVTTNITCTDYGSPRLTSTAPIHVEVTDVNDNSPKFEQHLYEVTLKENNDPMIPLLTVEAKDLDIGNNGLLTYSLSPDLSNEHINDIDLLKIDSVTGEIRSKVSLDREEHPYGLKVSVVAKDTGNSDNRSSDEIAVSILLEDVNDCAPQFLHSSYVLSTLENRPPGVDECSGPRPLSARDRDLGGGSWLYETSSPAFSVNAKTGEIRTKVLLDREAKSVYEFTVRVVDQGDSSLFTSAMIVVNVLDVNDHRPKIVFPSQHYIVTLPSNSPVGHSLPPVQAVDADVGDNARLQFSLLTGSSDYFRLLTDTGEVLVSDQWIHRPSHLKQFELFIGVHDSGNPILVGAAVVYRIREVNNASVAMDSASLGNGRAVLVLVAVAVVGTLTIAALSIAIILVKRQDDKKANVSRLTTSEQGKQCHQITNNHAHHNRNSHHNYIQPSSESRDFRISNNVQRQPLSARDLNLGIVEEGSVHSTESSNTDSGRGSNDDHTELDNGRIRHINS